MDKRADADAIEPGQTWINRIDGSAIVIETKSDLLAHWWKVRDLSVEASTSIDEETLRTTHLLDRLDSPHAAKSVDQVSMP